MTRRGHGPSANTDPEFVAGHWARRVARPIEFRPYQRLLVNPFLAFAVLASWFGVFLVGRDQTVAIALVAFPMVLVLDYFLVQVHCLDCGRTFSYWRCRRHACEWVLGRAESKRREWPRPPAPGAQFLGWIYLLIASMIWLGALFARP